MYYTKRERKPAELFLYYDSYTLDGEKIKTKQIANITANNSSTSINNRYEFNASSNKNTIAFVGIYPELNEGFFTMAISLFDQQAENFREFLFEFKTENKLEGVALSQLEIHNKGNVLINYLVKEEKTNRRSSKLLFISSDGKILLDQALEFEDFFMDNIKLKVSENNEIYFTGMLGTEENNNTSFGGFFIGRFNAETYEIETIKPYAYSEEFFLSLGYKVRENGKVTFSGYYTLDLVLKHNGGGFFIATHLDLKGFDSENLELVIIPFNEKLEMDNPKAIPRYLNTTAVPNGAGYFAFIRENQLHLIYTDHVENIETNLVEEAYKLDNPKDRKAATFLATIEYGESVRREVIVRDNEIGEGPA